MTSKILISSEICHDAVVHYLATRYRCTPEEVINRFLLQDKIITDPHDSEQYKIRLEENEMEILRDMHIRPSEIEFI